MSSNTFYSIDFDYEKQPLMDAYASANTDLSYIVPAGANSSALFSPFFEHFPPCVIPKDDRSITIRKFITPEYFEQKDYNGIIAFPILKEVTLNVYSYNIEPDAETGRATINPLTFTESDKINVESTLISSTQITQPTVISGSQLISFSKIGGETNIPSPVILLLKINGTESWANVCNVVIANSNTINWVESHEIIVLDEEVPQ